MNETLINAYHHLPPQLKSVAASARGYYLRSWRYGSDTEELIQAALERESWNAEQWKSWKADRLARLLHHAATHVPYYREMWADRRRHGNHSSWEDINNWPVLSKETLRSNPTAFIADGCSIHHMFHENTSGSTGKPLDFWWSKEMVRTYYAIYEARVRRWHGVNWKQNWAILGGQPVIPISTKRPPFWVHNLPLHQLYLSSGHLSKDNVPAFLAAMEKHQASHLIAYTSSVTYLARIALELGLQVTFPKLVFTNAEPLFPWQREVISQGLGATVRETYGMAEAVMAASECPCGKMHLWPEVGHVEVLSDLEDRRVALGDVGRFVCTALLNPSMPLIRYAVGDRGALMPNTAPCSCGRTLPMIARIEGRANDLLITTDGRCVFWVNPIFYGLPIQEAQIIQEDLTHLHIRYIPAPEFNKSHANNIIERLKMRLGEVKVDLEPVDIIARGANGKFRAVICNLPPDQRVFQNGNK